MYHSIRYHENLAVIRLNHALDSSQFMTIRDTYEGAFFRSFRYVEPYHCDYDMQYPEKPRLVFDFAQRNYGELYPLIRTLNQECG